MKKISIRKAIIILILLGAVGAAAVFAMTRKQEKISYKTTDVVLGEIVQTVNETGTVKAITELKLSFVGGGKLQRQNFKVGDQVKKDQLLAELDYNALVISKQEAKANFDVATENLNKLKAGASSADKSVAEAGVRQAKSSLDSAKKELEKLRGSLNESLAQAEKTVHELESNSADTIRPEEQAITTAETNLANAKTTYRQSINNSRDSALVVIADKISLANTALDAVNTVLDDDDADDYLSLKNPAYADLSRSSYREAVDKKFKAQTALSDARIGQSDANTSKALDAAISLLDACNYTLNNTFTALNNSVTSASFTQAEIDAYKSSMTAQINVMNGGISQLKSAEQSFQNALTAYDTNIKSAETSVVQAKSAYQSALTAAKNAVSSSKTSSAQQIESAQSRISAAEEALEVAEAQRDKVLSGADEHDIALNMARIRQAQAAIDSIDQQIKNSQILAPMDGIITDIAFKVGEQIAPNQTLYTLLGNGEYDIEVLISEADINKVKVGDPAEISLDAFGDETLFPGSVLFVEPAETTVQDVIYYKVKVGLEKNDAAIKPGMTANVTITTNRKANVFHIPSRAVIDKGAEGSFVRLLVANAEKEQKIITGLRGDGGDIEVVDGLKAGDVVITQVIEK